jgi:hypothetical protein
MFECKWCGSDVPLGSEYCPRCGNLFTPTRRCPKCGVDIPMTTRLCWNCGAITEAPVLAPAGAPAQQASAGPVPTDSYAAGTVARPRPEKQSALWKNPTRVDPVYFAPIVFAGLSLFFYWVPKVDVGLALIGLVCAGIGFYRHFTAPAEYKQFWVNILGLALSVLALILGLWVSIRVGQNKPIALILPFMLLTLFTRQID